ncbi:hypothetical protein EYC80_010653 [Monilinia laxa]|uniref:RING-type domain-containing protein n=1 Tax=Monilinia laxa TaxID=61186 RepID=A0A5N6JQG2_MONLA|nr:hypothetical protein EYC80_010653 [Monilinia laxa]
MKRLRNLARTIKGTCHIYKKNRQDNKQQGDYLHEDTPPRYSELFDQNEQDQTLQDSAEPQSGAELPHINENYIPIATRVYSTSPRVHIPIQYASVESQVTTPLQPALNHPRGNIDDHSDSLPPRIISNPRPQPSRSSLPSAVLSPSSQPSVVTDTDSDPQSRLPIHPKQPAFRSRISVANRPAFSQPKPVSAARAALASSIPVIVSTSRHTRTVNPPQTFYSRSREFNVEQPPSLQQTPTVTQLQSEIVDSELPIHQLHPTFRSHAPPAVLYTPRVTQSSEPTSLPRRSFNQRSTDFNYGNSPSTSRARTETHDIRANGTGNSSSNEDPGTNGLTSPVVALRNRVVSMGAPAPTTCQMLDRRVSHRPSTRGQSTHNNSGIASVGPRSKRSSQPLSLPPPQPEFLPERNLIQESRRTEENPYVRGLAAREWDQTLNICPRLDQRLETFEYPAPRSHIIGSHTTRSSIADPRNDDLMDYTTHVSHYLGQRIRVHRASRGMTRSRGMYNLRAVAGNPFPRNRDSSENWQPNAPANGPSVGTWTHHNADNVYEVSNGHLMDREGYLVNRQGERVDSHGHRRSSGVCGDERRNAIKILLTRISNTESEDTACFCSKPYSGPDHRAVKMPNCSHIFGDNCISQRLGCEDTCPLCRDKLRLPPTQR